MATRPKIDGNSTGLRIAAEASPKTLPVTPIWYPYEPNKYGKLGGDYKTETRSPIVESRMDRKGPITDLDSMGEWDTDLTYGAGATNIAGLIEGAVFANYRKKIELGGAGEITGVTGSTKTYTVAANGTNFRAGDLFFATGFTNSANNSLHRVASSTGTTVVGIETNVDETPPTAAKLVVCGFQFGSGEASITVTGVTWPRITRASGTKDFTQFGLIPGEWIFIGDSSNAAYSFATAACNGWARVRSVSATYIELDKTTATFVDDTGTSKTIRLFFGRVAKNEALTTGSNPQVRKTYQLERSLGQPDDASSNIQSEYILGAIVDELTFNIEVKKILSCNLKFVGMDYQPVDAATGLKSGTRPALVAEDAFNATSHVKRQKFARVPTTAGSAANANLTPVMAYIESAKITVKNGVDLNKAISVLGAFDSSTGNIQPSIELKGYLQTTEAMLVRSQNANCTFDCILVKSNQGIVIDVPLIGLTDGMPEVEKNKPIMVPLKGDASDAIDVDPSMRHCILFGFFDYLPSNAN